jgi:hypothetical protein
VQFSYVHLARDSSESEALASVSVPVLVQPTDAVSGSAALVSALVTRYNLLQCDFSVYGNKSSVSSVAAWYSLGSVSFQASAGVSSCSLNFDSSVFADGVAHVSVSMGTSGGVFVAERAVVVSNAGPAYCFSTAGGPVYSNDSSVVSVTVCPGSVSGGAVTFYREYYSGGEVVSQLIGTAAAAPYSAALPVSDLALGSSVFVKAVSSSGSSSVFAGEVTLGSTFSPTSAPSTFSPTPAIHYSSPVSICGSVPGVGACNTGDVFLLGNYLRLGIHNAGSFGSTDVALNGLSRLGLIADIYKTGWDAAPSTYAGDYCALDALSIEGWVTAYNESRNAMLTVNEGLQQYQGLPTGSFDITSVGTRKSALWSGASGSMSVRKVTAFGDDDLFVRTSVTLKNSGPNIMSDVYCE